jgi:ABC-type nitrate/sulfonate/bicarbonate transport system permease component
MLPSPVDVVRAFISEFPVLMAHSATSLGEAFLGLFLGIAAAFLIAIAMDANTFFHNAMYPVLLLTQTIPTIAIAPLLVLWMGYGIAPKITLVFLVCFFPLAIGLLDGFHSADGDAIRLLQSMSATRTQIFFHIKLPYAMPGFFIGLKASVTYCVVGAVIAEWLGGNSGLGVYMTRVRKSYAFDKMFAVILLVSLLSLSLMGLVLLIEKKTILWKES